MDKKDVTHFWSTGHDSNSNIQLISNSVSEDNISEAIYKAVENMETTQQDSYTDNK